jgi:hypothetical protein
MHEGLYENQRSLSLPLYRTLAEALHLSERALSEALENGAFRPKVRRRHSRILARVQRECECEASCSVSEAIHLMCDRVPPLFAE